MKAKTAVLALAMCLCAGRANALEYTMDAPEDYLFARPTSIEVVYGQEEAVNVDRSKNVSLIPPGFGTPASYLPGSGAYLTPNLVPGALNGGLVNAVGTGNTYAGYVLSGESGNVIYPSITGGGESFYTDAAVWDYAPYTDYSSDWGWDSSGYYGVSYTDVTSSLYYSGGYLGTLKIPAIGVNAKIYEGTSTTQLAKGVGHFTDTSIWDGNACFAAHNRGTNALFGQIHTLDIGDRITLTTKLGTRTYSVASVKKISETDNSDTAGTWENCITLFTCVRNESEYRWCVRAVEVSG